MCSVTSIFLIKFIKKSIIEDFIVPGIEKHEMLELFQGVGPCVFALVLREIERKISSIFAKTLKILPLALLTYEKAAGSSVSS